MNGAKIDFAYRTFKWHNAAKHNAAVHCVIIGFSSPATGRASSPCEPPRLIFDESGVAHPAAHINGYLVDAPDIYIASRTKPLCDVPEIGIGNKPIDGGNYLFTEEEKAAFLAKEPAAAKLFHPFLGADEFINGLKRYCLWLGDCPPNELKKLPECLKRVEAVRTYRLASKSAGTRKLASTPTRFHVENMPKTNFIVIPQVSSERRAYIPIGFLGPETLCSDKVRISSGATLYHFAVLTSSTHNAWMRATSCRLKSDYSYTINLTYNDFVWPKVTEAQKEELAAAGQGILDARAAFPKATLADLYDPDTMPPALLKAHEKVDRLVLKAYGLPSTATEPEIVAHLMGLYAAAVPPPVSG